MSWPRLDSSGCPYLIVSCSQDSVPGTLYVVPMGRVSPPQRGATARVTAQTAATNPHPVVGGPERSIYD